ncbi:MAG TPA: penicillin acylase family protein [Bryobacteraceae bacterium]|nr:penicillin acylase family protein [Bryobacteraceae bacterium]
MSIAVLIALIAVAIYWYAFRPLPKTSGQISAPIYANATILRDARGVPHIQAASWQDAIFLQGFATAQDRLWQMDSLRRFGAGELSEVLGRGTLALDERSRLMRMRGIAENELRFLTPEDRAVLVEYARGVNYFIDTHRGDYQLEFNLPGHVYSPRQWTIVDSLMIGLVMFRDLTDKSIFEFQKGLLLSQATDPTKVFTLFPAVEGHDFSPGSNAWAVSGAHAANGQPMLANDPHLRYSVPATWHLVQLTAPGLNVEGAALPGVPCVISGHNNQIAWGVTNLAADVMDLYVEQMDEAHGTYIYQGKLEQAQLDRQMIGVRGEAPVPLSTWVTRHGPVILHANGKSYAMRWSATDGFGFPFFDIDRSQNWQQFRAAISRFWGPGQNFVYADRAGNIGYQAAGRVPIRKNFQGNTPLDGASGNFEWSGYIPFDQLPSIYNPAGGIIATANQNPFPPGFPYRVDGSFDDAYRVDQIRARLAAKQKLAVPDMLAIQKDVYSAFESFLAKQIVSAYSKSGSRHELASEALRILRNWNGQMDKDLAAPTIVEFVRQEMNQNLVAGVRKPGVVAGSLVPQQDSELIPRAGVLQMLLTTRPSGWVDKNNWDAWLMNRFNSALTSARDHLGSPVSKWHWGRVLRWNLQHPVGRELPLVNRFFDIGPIAMSGCGTCVKQTSSSLGPSERMVVDIGHLDSSVQNLTVGESGHVASSYYKDEWPAYYTGRSFPMQFDHIDAKDVLKIAPSQP